MAAFAASVGPLLVRAPRGDGHRVLVLPGFTADDLSTRPLRWFLRRLGYRPAGWRLGRNLGPSERILDGLLERFESVASEDGPVSIVGWSLGGVYARELARHQPEHVRQVITLGSPLRLAGGTPLSRLRPGHRPRTSGPLPVPSTAVYSRSDGVVHWRSAMEPDGPRRESIEVRGSHCGLGHNPRVLQIVADRLAQPAGTWAPYERSRT
jgi:pimeloyl-ACP methyl ester carboxylesterase